MIRFNLKDITIGDMEALERVANTYKEEIEVEYINDTIIIRVQGGRL